MSMIYPEKEKLTERVAHLFLRSFIIFMGQSCDLLQFLNAGFISFFWNMHIYKNKFDLLISFLIL